MLSSAGPVGHPLTRKETKNPAKFGGHCLPSQGFYKSLIEHVKLRDAPQLSKYQFKNLIMQTVSQIDRLIVFLRILPRQPAPDRRPNVRVNRSVRLCCSRFRDGVSACLAGPAYALGRLSERPGLVRAVFHNAPAFPLFGRFPDRPIQGPSALKRLSTRSPLNFGIHFLMSSLNQKSTRFVVSRVAAAGCT